MWGADDLAAWLVAVPADAGTKKLVGLVLGSEQERVPRPAAAAAVRRVAEDLRPDGAEADELAAVISQVFGAPVPAAPLMAEMTVLEAVRAGIARQLAILDDPDLTGIGESAAEVLGVGASYIAEHLADHLLREIIARGAHGGALQPLADQLNHEMTRFSGSVLRRRSTRWRTICHARALRPHARCCAQLNGQFSIRSLSALTLRAGTCSSHLRRCRRAG